MAGNTIGRLFRVTTFGESHGPVIGVVIDGVKPGIPFDLSVIQHELDRRRPGQSAMTTPRNEADRAQVLSGVFDGKTTGTPLCLVVWNTDQRPEAYRAIRNLFRPGHAIYTYLSKFGIADYRGGGRSSGRETIGRVAAGAVAKALLEKRGTRIRGYSLEIAGVRAKTIDYDFIEKNNLRAPDPTVYRRMERRVLTAKEQGDSVGGIVEVVVENPPPGLGEPVFDKLEADLAKSLLSIGAIRGFEVGNGFAAARLRGSENNDAIYAEKKTGRIRTRTNRAGGIAGGISNGEPIIVRIAVKPPSSIKKEQETTTLSGKAAKISVKGRHDPCICPRVVPVAEAMVAITLLEHLFRQQLVRRGSQKRALREALDVIDANLAILRSERRAIKKDLIKDRKSG